MTVIGIRLEDKNEWERRTPLVPGDVAELVSGHGLRVLVEPSEQRIHADGEYLAAGAELASGLDEARVIFAVKEVPPEKLLPERAYVFFAHVIKGQKRNMRLLEGLLEKQVTLIDYECIADGDGNRLISFGREAGQIGMIESLHALGRRLEWEGNATAISDVRRAFQYEDADEAKAAVAGVGERLARGFAVDDPPLVAGFTGRGRVSRGAQEIFDLLPHEEVRPEDLAELEETGGRCDRFYKVVFGKQHLAQPREPGRAFDEDEYRHHPERFRGGRLVRYLPHLTLLMNGVFWTDAYPRFFTRQEASAMWMAGGRKLRVIGDVSCDTRGSIEINHRPTTPTSPTYVFDPIANAFHDGYEGPGIIVLAVDNLPCELPRDSSRNFSEVLSGLVPAIARADYRRPFADLDLPPAILNAVVTHQGRLTPGYEYLEEYLEGIGLSA